MTKNDKPFTKEELEHYRKKLLDMRQKLVEKLEQMREDTLVNTREGGGELSGMPIHLADLGTDNFQQEFMVGVLEEEMRQLNEIDAALRRIDEGTYGICEDCQKRIPKARLNAVPQALLCVDCKRLEERELGY